MRGSANGGERGRWGRRFQLPGIRHPESLRGGSCRISLRELRQSNLHRNGPCAAPLRSPDGRAAISAGIADRIGFGCGRLRAGLEERNSRKLVDAAFECGIRYFDTAPSYGDGASERILGVGLRHVRREVLICTKIGFPRPRGNPSAAAVRALLRAAVKPIYRRLTGGRRRHARLSGEVAQREAPHGSFELAQVRAGVQQSLQALQTDRVECLMLHEPRLTDPAPDIGTALRDLVAEGIVERIGVGTGSAIEALPPFGSVAQAALTASLLDSLDSRALIAHGLFRDMSAETLERSVTESGLIRHIPSLGAHLGTALGASALLLNCAVLGTRLDRVLWSTSSVIRLRSVLAAAAAIYDEARSAWSPDRAALFADSLRRYVYRVHAAA